MTAFEKALAEGDFASICQSRIAQAKTKEEKSDWEVIQTLVSDNPRKQLVDFLGFKDDADEAANNVPKLETDGDEVKDLPASTNQAQLNGTGNARHNRLSSFFDNSADGDNFLSHLSATKGAKTNSPFKIYTVSESMADRQITRALLLGHFEAAMDICLREDRMSDAFMMAICGGESCIEKVQAAYFGKKAKGPNYLRLLASVVGKNLWDVVHNADLSDWKEVMATLCTFADEKEFPDLCEALGDRLEEEMKTDGNENKAEYRKDACFCYLAGSKLEKVVAIWIEETQEDEAAGLQEGSADSTFSLHAHSLQSFIEKVTVFRKVTKFEDIDRSQTADWKLAALYDKYAEYADVAAAHGSLEVAEKYLNLLPLQYAAAEVARNRVKQATRKATSAPVAKQGLSATRSPARIQPAGRGALQTQQMGAVNPGAANTYTPMASAQPTVQPMAPAAGNYAPVGYQQPQHQQQAFGAAPNPQSFGGYYPGAGVGPPRNLNASPSIPPPSRAADMSNWNDTPMVTKPPTIRRGTPGAGAAPVTSPFLNQQQPGFQAPPSAAPFSSQQKATPPLPPPPRGSAAPQRMSSPPAGAHPLQQAQPFDRPPSVTRNPYAPPSVNQPGGGMAPPAMPRGPSPYNPPPAAAPPSNRYAPAAPSQTMNPPDPQGRPLPPPPLGAMRSGPQPSPYVQQPDQYSAQPLQHSQSYSNPSAPQYGQGTAQGLPQGPLQSPGPGTASSQRPSAPTPSPASSKYRKCFDGCSSNRRK